SIATTQHSVSGTSGSANTPSVPSSGNASASSPACHPTGEPNTRFPVRINTRGNSAPSTRNGARIASTPCPNAISPNRISQVVASGKSLYDQSSARLSCQYQASSPNGASFAASTILTNWLSPHASQNAVNQREAAVALAELVAAPTVVILRSMQSPIS